MWYYLLVLLSLLIFVKGETDWAASCPSYCRCKWVSGKKSTECTEGNLEEVPGNLSSEVQSLNISGNSIIKLPKHTFQNVNLVNIHKLYIRNCGLKEINENAFEGLKILIELDLSDNHVEKLNRSTFKGMERLRVLLFNNNKLITIESDLLSNLKFLQRVEFSNNNLTSVSSSAFMNDEKLKYVVLNDNKLTYMDPIELKSGQNLSSLVLHNNRWHCDCKLKKFRNWTIQKNLYTPPTNCHEPENLRGRLWNEIDPEQFNCKPNILEIGAPINMNNDATQSIICKVYGDPIPQVGWLLNNHPINPMKDKSYTIEESRIGANVISVNLTIKKPKKQDNGELICSAINPGGIEQKNVSYVVKPLSGLDTFNTLLNWLILCVVLIIIFIFICILLLCYYFGKKKKTLLKHDMNTSNGSAPTDESDPQKSLITAVNPVEKPPRRQEAAPSVASYGTEMSEINRTLLDNDSVLGPANELDEETHSLNYIDHKPKQVKDRLPADFLRSERPYPPDLLSFPSRSSQISPAGSCASTIPDHSRPLPPHNLQSPLHSPMYNSLPPNSSIFRTLPHSRSQSPFASPGCIPVQSRQGYVTIPRRPRVPSWSAPSSTIGSEVVEPVYDNLGLRTTADGSSMLSLNKVEASPIGIRNRPLPTTPITPIYQKNGLPTHYAPIEEHESPPAPCPTQHQNSQMGTLHKSPMSPYSPSERASHENWITGSNRDSANLSFLSPSDNTLRNQLSPSLSTNSIPGRSPKVPPKPPPKPKNKSSINSPLFEDEGEDGTEV